LASAHDDAECLSMTNLYVFPPTGAPPARIATSRRRRRRPSRTFSSPSIPHAEGRRARAARVVFIVETVPTRRASIEDETVVARIAHAAKEPWKPGGGMRD
jgi:hypothetical protein